MDPIALEKRPFRSDIQGLRAVAVCAVVLYHVGVPGLRGGYVGVDIFFVISGYLISRQLLEVHGNTWASLSTFYARRARRLLPAALFVIAGSSLLAWVFLSSLQLKAVSRDAIAATLYVPNILFAVRGLDYLNKSDAPSLLSTIASGGLAVSLMGSYYAANAAALQTAKTVTPVAISKPPQFTSYVPDNLIPALQQASDDVPILYTNGCHLDYPGSAAQTHCTFGHAHARLTVALFGDSHAAQWFPALDELANAHDFRLITYTKSDCEVVQNNQYSACQDWRRNVLAKLKSSPPDLVIISSFEEYSHSRVSWERALTAVIEQLRQFSKVAVIADTPHFSFIPAECLAVHLTDTQACGAPRGKALVTDRAQDFALAAQHAGAAIIDLSDYLCTQSRCDPVIGNHLVYRDDHHMTASFALTLEPVLWDELAPMVSTP